MQVCIVFKGVDTEHPSRPRTVSCTVFWVPGHLSSVGGVQAVTHLAFRAVRWKNTLRTQSYPFFLSGLVELSGVVFDDAAALQTATEAAWRETFARAENLPGLGEGRQMTLVI